jgi:thioredoxin reductase (NADPH)
VKDSTHAAGHDRELDLLVVGAGPTGIAIGAEARRRGLGVLLLDRGPLVAAIQGYPTDLVFFTTRDKLEIAGVPFTIAEDKPSRRQAIVYYRGVVESHGVPLALGEEVAAVTPPPAPGGRFTVESVRRGERHVRHARAVALATGYFDNPLRLGVPGEDLLWVGHRYLDPYRHYGQHVVVVGAGNTAAEAALDLWRNGVRVTLVHRRHGVKRSVKYWLKPDVENRVEEGSIAARWETLVTAFREDGEARFVDVCAAGSEPGAAAVESIPADAAYVFIGYEPDVSLQRGAGVEVDPETLVPTHDPATCESNVPGLYVAGTLLAGKATDRIFIENSRQHAPLIVGHLAARLSRDTSSSEGASSSEDAPALLAGR